MIGKELLTPSRSYFIARCGGFINIVRLAGLPIPPRSQRDVDGERRQRAYHETKARRKAPRSRNDDGSRITNDQIRSEEHTSELQSLMRTSYAVLCLKNKTNKNRTANF